MLGHWAAAARSPFCVLFPHYSLAPEARYPVALEELLRVYAWVRRRSPRVCVGGDSAGGNLSCALTLRCLMAGAPPPPDGLALVLPRPQPQPLAQPQQGARSA